ncbi:lytic transglycosylase domain-containing protein [Rhizobium tumorigenes]|uniref:Lytic transglycosylase domain-containing protein n=1 Tax=Rhizobium tumorigenes TaxID=2041385 RepID=A0AAF1KFI2_9HYPH|nr:lytic transglycosylase domain-containing protein [Rhizobium tumorigenes]WFR97667.1 lytic transglycosylase domain-containing protein [Rhizobium tumorigenes]
MTDAPGRALCIHAGSLNRDICSALEKFATRSQLPPDFFARLIWRESRFRAEAISPKGAQGIAQFMPATAALRGLKDSFDLLEALRASSQYLMKLRTRFGNLGLAAAAYNAGEQRVSTFMLVGDLPSESRNYVFGITGHTVDEWRRSPSDLALPPLDEHRAFMDACVALAATRRLVEPAEQSEGVWTPWGAQLAAAASSVTARTLFARVSARLPAPLNTEAPIILRKIDRDFGYRPRYSARIGRTQRRDAEDTCKIVERAGFPCLVFKNF